MNVEHLTPTERLQMQLQLERAAFDAHMGRIPMGYMQSSYASSVGATATAQSSVTYMYGKGIGSAGSAGLDVLSTASAISPRLASEQAILNLASLPHKTADKGSRPRTWEPKGNPNRPLSAISKEERATILETRSAGYNAASEGGNVPGAWPPPDGKIGFANLANRYNGEMDAYMYNNPVAQKSYPSHINFSLVPTTATQHGMGPLLLGGGGRGGEVKDATEIKDNVSLNVMAPRRKSSGSKHTQMGSNKKKRGPSQEQLFPTKLRQALSDPSLSDVITWMPHGRSWFILDSSAFVDRVSKKYFSQNKLDSFKRQVRGWGFRLLKQGLDRGSYYHELFSRDNPHLAQYMETTKHKSLKQSRKSTLGSKRELEQSTEQRQCTLSHHCTTSHRSKRHQRHSNTDLDDHEKAEDPRKQCADLKQTREGVGKKLEADVERAPMHTAAQTEHKNKRKPKELGGLAAIPAASLESLQMMDQQVPGYYARDFQTIKQPSSLAMEDMVRYNAELDKHNKANAQAEKREQEDHRAQMHHMNKRKLEQSIDQQNTSHDSKSLEGIRDKLKAIAKANREVLSAIEERKNEKVTSGFLYSLKCNLDKDEIGRGREKPWTLIAEPVSDSVANRIRNWRYAGQPLEEAEDVFHDQVNYRLQTHADVVRLNDDMLKVGTKYCTQLADKPKTRYRLRVFLANFGILQVAVKQLNEVIFEDTKDEISGSEEAEEGMRQIISGFKKLQKGIPSAKLNVSCEKYYVGSGMYCGHHRKVNCTCSGGTGTGTGTG